jgi:hypothetical protein
LSSRGRIRGGLGSVTQENRRIAALWPAWPGRQNRTGHGLLSRSRCDRLRAPARSPAAPARHPVGFRPGAGERPSTGVSTACREPRTAGGGAQAATAAWREQPLSDEASARMICAMVFQDRRHAANPPRSQTAALCVESVRQGFPTGGA